MFIYCKCKCVCFFFQTKRTKYYTAYTHKLLHLSLFEHRNEFVAIIKRVVFCLADSLASQEEISCVKLFLHL
jgi:hypothetical protein